MSHLELFLAGWFVVHGMREKYLEAFDSIAVDCLNGDKYKTGKLTPEGKPDPIVFSTESNREGIQAGTDRHFGESGNARNCPSQRDGGN